MGDLIKVQAAGSVRR